MKGTLLVIFFDSSGVQDHSVLHNSNTRSIYLFVKLDTQLFLFYFFLDINN
jgi:hypothetical protein